MPITPNQQVKQQNLDCIRSLMRNCGTATKAQLSKLSGLSVVTLGSLMQELRANGEVLEGALFPSIGGRPAQTYSFNADFAHVLTLYILQQDGVDTLCLSTADLRGKVLRSGQAPIPESATQMLLETVTHQLENDPLIAAIGIGIPGQALDGMVLFCDVGELTGVPLAKLLHERTGIIPIIENDMNAAVYGYACRTQPCEEDCTVGVYFPMAQKPGAGILLGERLLRGKNGLSGELGNLPIPVDWVKPKQPFEQIISDYLQAVAAILAPECIVLYRDRLDRETLERCMDASWPAQTERPVLVTNVSLAPDYALGIQELALAQLLPTKTERFKHSKPAEHNDPA